MPICQAQPMATPRKTQSKTPEKPSDGPDPVPSKTYGRTDAARFLGISLSSIKRLEKEGELVPDGKDARGHHWYEANTLEAYRASKAGLPPPEVEKVIATIDAANSSADKSAKHVERALGLVFEPSETLLLLLKELLAECRAENKDLRAENLGLLTQLRDILKDQRQEDLDARIAERKAQQRDMAIAMVRDAIPLVVAQLTGSKAAGQIMTLVRSMTPEQIAILLKSGLLTEKQAESLRLVLTSDQKIALSKLADTSEEEKPEGSG